MEKDRTLIKKIQMSLGIYLFSILMLFVLIYGMGCKSSITGQNIAPDSTHYSTIFNEIIDQDSVVHWYTNLYDGNKWCYYHHQYEDLRNVR
jgi:hypothetical protein